MGGWQLDNRIIVTMMRAFTCGCRLEALDRQWWKIDPCVDLWYAAEKPEFPFECGASFHSVEQSEQFWKSFFHLKEETPSGRMIRMIHGSFRTLPLSFSIQSWFSDIFIAFVSATVARLGGNVSWLWSLAEFNDTPKIIFSLRLRGRAR